MSDVRVYSLMYIVTLMVGGSPPVLSWYLPPPPPPQIQQFSSTLLPANTHRTALRDTERQADGDRPFFLARCKFF